MFVCSSERVCAYEFWCMSTKGKRRRETVSEMWVAECNGKSVHCVVSAGDTNLFVLISSDGNEFGLLEDVRPKGTVGQLE